MRLGFSGEWSCLTFIAFTWFRFMSAIPQRFSRVRQVSDYLRKNIESGAWVDWIPGERELASTLQVGRNTLRAALAELAAAGVVKACHGVGHHILRSGVEALPVQSALSNSIGLLTPRPLYALKPRTALWIDRLRALLIERGLRLHTHHGEHYTHARATAARQRLLGQRAHDAWVLSLCDHPVQRWFARQGVPCVLAGSAQAGNWQPNPSGHARCPDCQCGTFPHAGRNGSGERGRGSELGEVVLAIDVKHAPGAAGTRGALQTGDAAVHMTGVSGVARHEQGEQSAKRCAVTNKDQARGNIR